MHEGSSLARNEPMVRRDPLTIAIEFARSIGIPVHETKIARPTRVPGVDIVSGCVHVDSTELRGLGDFLHEVAHVALTPVADRHRLDEWITGTAAQEMSALAWTWALGQHLGLDPADVFHDAVISGNGPTLRENFIAGQYVGVPMLQYWRLTNVSSGAGEAKVTYPQMARWTRD